MDHLYLTVSIFMDDSIRSEKTNLQLQITLRYFFRSCNNNNINLLHYTIWQLSTNFVCLKCAVFDLILVFKISDNDLVSNQLNCITPPRLAKMTERIGDKEGRVKSGHFGPQVNSDTHLQTVDI